MKSITKFNKPLFFAILFLAIAVFGFGKAEEASAAPKNSCYIDGVETLNTTREKCTQLCNEKTSAKTCFFYADPTAPEIIKSAIPGGSTGGSDGDVCDLSLTEYFSLKLIKCLLLYILKLIGLLVSAATTLFIWVVDANNLKKVLSNPVIYDMWRNVRDTLNVAFILTLLFSAFCTVFQVEKYNYKKILLTLIIMALLVNFSFPITRVIIDFSNVIMYYFIQGLGLPVQTAFGEMAKNGGLSQLMHPGAEGTVNVNSDMSFLLAAVVFLFIFAVTIFVIAALLLIRLVVLAILIIFSSIAFVGSIVPFLSTQASKWWDTLFKYAFFGPVMIFMMSVALKMMKAINEFQGTFKNISGTQSAEENISQEIAAMAFFSIPLVILWIGIGFAQSMSIAGAGAITGRANKFMGWSARTLTGYRFGKAAGGAGAHWVNRKLAETQGLRYLSPMAMKDAWKRRTERSDRKALSMSSGKIQNKLNQVIGRVASLNPVIAANRFSKGFKAEGVKGGFKNTFIKPLDIDATDYDFIEQQRFANEEKDRISKTNDTSGYVLHELNMATTRKEAGDAAVVAGAQKILAQKNDLNDYAYSRGLTTDPQKVKTSLAKDLSNAGMTKTESVVKSLMATGDIAFNSGGFGYGGMGKFIPSKNPDGTSNIDDRDKINLTNYRTLEELQRVEASNNKEIDNPNFEVEYKPGFYFTTAKEQAKIGAGKFGNNEPQTRQRTAHPDAFYEIDSEGKVVDLHLGGELSLKKVNAGDIENAKRARDSVERHWQAYNKYMTEPAFKARVDAMGDNVVAYLKKAWHIQENLSDEKPWHAPRPRPSSQSSSAPQAKAQPTRKNYPPRWRRSP